MKLNNKGFVVSTLMYALLIVFLFLIIGIITLLSNRKMILDKLKKDVKEDVNGMIKYQYYPNGTAIYYNPVTNKICTDYEEENSLNENKTGCMRWYTFNDDINSNKVNMILDHNTTYEVPWNSTNSNSGGMKEVKDELDKLTSESKWKVLPRLITADEVAHVIGADRDDAIKWSSKDRVRWIYLDGSGTTDEQWRTNGANAINKSKYDWLYNYLKTCEAYGCTKEDNNSFFGYWTSTPTVGNGAAAYMIYFPGKLEFGAVNGINRLGIRPVITIEKKVLSTPFTVAFDYTGEPQTFVRPVPGSYKIELWGAQGGSKTDSNYKLGGYVSGTIKLNSNSVLYTHVGEKGKKTNSLNLEGTFNGGGSSYFPDDRGIGASGGGATDIRLVNGNWKNFSSLKSRIIVAGAAGALGYHNGTQAGAAGGLTGYDATTGTNDNWIKTAHYGLGGTQTAPGAWGNSDFNWEAANHITPAGFGYGGNGVGSYDGGGSGGGGYYGGGGSIVQSGAGGSSFISGHAGCVAITKDSTEDNIKQVKDSDGKTCTDGTTDITCSYHYSGLKFTDTVMIDGAGCKWTTEKTTDCSGMPTHDGKSTMTGNEGNGYAKITYLGK